MDANQYLVPLADGRFAEVSREDWGWATNHSWSVTRGYARARINKEWVYLHLEIAKRAGIKPNPKIDHRDRNPLNCKRDNLRGATNSQNLLNQDRANATGYHGVRKMGQRYKAYGRKSGHLQVHLGMFATPEEAAQAYNDFAIKTHGEFAVLNEV